MTILTLRAGYPAYKHQVKTTAPAFLLGAAPGLPCVPTAPAPASRLGTAPGPPRAPVAPALASRPGAVPGPPRSTWAPAPTIWLMAALELTRVLRTGSVGCKQINKYPLSTRSSWSPSGRVRAYLPRCYAIRAAPHARRACSRRPIKCRWDVWQADCSDLSQYRVVQQLWATGRLQPGVSTVGHLSDTATGLVTQRHKHRTDNWMQGVKWQDPTCPCCWRHHWLLLAVVPYNVGFAYPRATCRTLGAHCKPPDLEL
jgi:hypothetical protein